MVSLSFLQGIFPTQGLNPDFPHCRRIFNQLSHKGSPRILEYVAYPFSSGTSQPNNRTGISCIAGGFFTNWVMREAQVRWMERAAWSIHTIICKVDGQWKFSAWLRELNPGLCNNLEEWERVGGGREVQECGNTCISSVQSLSHVQLCKPMNRSTPSLPVHHQLPEFT